MLENENFSLPSESSETKFDLHFVLDNNAQVLLLDWLRQSGNIERDMVKSSKQNTIIEWGTL